MEYLPFLIASTLLFSIGLFGLLAQPHLVRKVIALNVMAGGIFLFLVAVARRNALDSPDPVPHAMVLTGLVVSLAATAFALALARRIHAATGEMRLPDPGEGP